MSAAAEWQQLKAQLRRGNYTQDGFKNQFFRRLLVVLADSGASILDKLLAYRDALLASDDPLAEKLSTDLDRNESRHLLELVGLSVDAQGQVYLDQEKPISDELAPIYGLEPRRFIHPVPTDPALRTRLRDDHFANYNGVAQRLAVRLAITSPQRSTLIINLPTGCGKTLVAHAISLFAPEGQLTVVVVPTIGLAIEQGERAAALFKRAGSDHAGSYCWHGQQTAIEHEEIKARIRDRRQRLLPAQSRTHRTLIPFFRRNDSGSPVAPIDWIALCRCFYRRLRRGAPPEPLSRIGNAAGRRSGVARFCPCVLTALLDPDDHAER